MNREEVITAAISTANVMASDRLRREDARLYSHHSRLQNQQPGLPSWKQEEMQNRMHDAVLLLSTGTILKEAGSDRWRQCVQRSGELLEWMSNIDSQQSEVPTALLSGAAYFIAGYPAQANALLRDNKGGSYSEILRSFFRGNLSITLENIRRYWEGVVNLTTTQPNPNEKEDFANHIVEEVIRSLGVICSATKWPDESRIQSANQRLNTLASVYAADHAPFSWLIARLTCLVSIELSANNWRIALRALESRVQDEGRIAIDRYCRLAYVQHRPYVWPSQVEGITRLLKEDSFALCTPTGSGKTSVAEIALISAMFPVINPATIEMTAPLAMYLVPSRALAAEVEGKLTTIFRRLSTQRIVVTGLYGGSDWGPTDAWLTSDDPTILICTYEKAEALIRFVGPLMLSRLTLVIFDEAHTVQFNDNISQLRNAENRSLRLESLGLRLSQLVDREQCRMIGLSAVAAGIEQSIQNWVSGSTSGVPVRVQYRSTRQMIGRLLVSQNGSFEIRYDVLDGHHLAFQEDGDATPYVRDPIPPRPSSPTWSGSEKELRPALFWAALNLSAPDENGRRHTVLISITARIAGYAKDFLDLLETHWIDKLPFKQVASEGPASDLLSHAMMVAQDYFGVNSYEYRLLKFGIAIHHSNMPKMLTRLIIELIQSHAISIVMATSTLSEGINIPVETILIPSLHRARTRINASEFRNLAGRAGRPGVATEGRTLVLMRSQPTRRDRIVIGYNQLVEELANIPPIKPKSAIAAALEDIRSQWTLLSGNSELEPFLEWLEKVTLSGMTASQQDSFGSIDSVDNVLLSGIVETEEVDGAIQWEQRLQQLWNSSFAIHSASEATRLAFLRRGQAIPVLYPNKERRRLLYRTGLPPRTAAEVLARMPQIRQSLVSGVQYARWTSSDRFGFIASIIVEISQIDRFRVPEASDVWQGMLKWWLIHDSINFPAPNKIADWYAKIHQWFGYRFCWAIGSVIGVAFEDISGGELRSTTLEDWESTGLPWITFWLKEIIAWGTLDPVAAFLLSSGVVRTRAQAEQQAVKYYQRNISLSDNSLLDPRTIRSWMVELFPEYRVKSTTDRQFEFTASIVDESIKKVNRRYRVLPILESSSIGWLDVAGYLLAQSPKHVLDVLEDAWETYDFLLDVTTQQVTASSYL